MGKIIIGISAWSERSLVESGFYPPEVKTPAERLRYYSERFPLAEIDATYHYFATRRNLDLWLGNTPAGFTFDVRAFSLFTQHPTPMNSLPRGIREAYGREMVHEGNLYPHHLPEKALEELWQGFIRTLEAFRAEGKLGVVLFQFPPWFHPVPNNFDYLVRCRERLAGFTLTVEFRYNAWLNDENREDTLDFLREQGLALACVDELQGFASSLPPVAEVTANPGFVRFHGRNAVNWEKKDVAIDERFRYLYDESELREWVPRLRRMAESSETLHVIFKNKLGDYPVRNALQLKDMLQE